MPSFLLRYSVVLRTGHHSRGSGHELSARLIKPESADPLGDPCARYVRRQLSLSCFCILGIEKLECIVVLDDIGRILAFVKVVVKLLDKFVSGRRKKSSCVRALFPGLSCHHHFN